MTLSSSELKQPLKVPLGFIGIMAALVLCVIGIQTGDLRSLRSRPQTLTKAEIEQDAKDKSNRIALLQKAPSFGFDNLISGLMLIDFLQYFGEENARKTNGYGIGMDYFDLIIDKDPRFFYSYFFMSITGSIYSGQPERSVALMDKGFKSIGLHAPEASYYLWRLKGTDELLFLGNSQAAQKSMLTAADWASKIGDAESQQIGEISRKTAEFLAKNPNSKQAQFAAWTMVLQSAVDINARKIAVFKIRELGGKVELDSKGEPKITPPSQD
jgi:hypothetical protein